MRLRDASVLSGAILMLCASAGCNMFRSSNRITYQNNPDDGRNVKGHVTTPHEASQNEIGLAQEYIQQGKYDIALEDIQKAIKLEPTSADAYTMLGLLNEKINRPDQANAAYTKSVGLAPNDGNVLNNYGAWLCRSGHPAEADPQFRKALADPFYKTPTAARSNAAVCAFKAGNAELAEGYDRQVLAAEPNNMVALQSMAEIKYQHGDYMNARGFMERLLAAGKVGPDSLDLAAHIEDKLGDQESARTLRNRLSTEFPQYTPGQL